MLIYVLVKKLPVEERFALNSQIRRAANRSGRTLLRDLAGIRIKRIFSFAGRLEVLLTR